MVLRDQIIEPYREDAQRLVTSGAAAELEFSKETYQVRVTDGEEYWPVLQLGEGEEVQGVLCQCEVAEKEPTCPHLAAALLRILGESGVPLHVRFASSLWNVLCRLFAERQGYDTDVLTRIGDGDYALDTVTHKRLFYVKAKDADAANSLFAMVEGRVRETEETSIKFSNLSGEELSLWREGRPSFALRYELSFWSDLAKMLMLLQDSGAPYTLGFDHASSGVINFIRADFEKLSVGFYVSAANLSAIIPALKSVGSPLRVFDLQSEVIERIIYDREEGSLHVIPKESVSAPDSASPPDGGILIDGWRFVPDVGFFLTERHSLLDQPEISPQSLAMMLDEHASLIAEHLEGERVHMRPRTPSYALRFDANWNLHISCYLFNPGDLQSPQSRVFGSWVYLEDDGFYPLQEQRFSEGEQVIPPDMVSSFVHKMRSWLNTKEGFQTHLTTIQSQLVYDVSDQGELSFDSCVELPEGEALSHDFGDWIYLAGEGFYSKVRVGGASPVRPGTTVKRDAVSLFIKMHMAELELIEGFFSQVSPVVRVALRISLVSPHVVELLPRYTLAPSERGRRVQYFDDYTYVPGEGFAEIPKEALLPERFRNPQKLTGQELKLFLAYELDALEPYIEWIDPRLQKPKALALKLVSAKKERAGVSLELTYVSAQGSADAASLWYAMSRGERFYFSPAGFLDFSDARFGWLRQLPAARVERSGNFLRLTPLEFFRLSAMEDLERAASDASEEHQRLIRSLASQAPPTAPDLEGLKSTLRHYQVVGVDWLWFLYENFLSGLLCDDMGLGKTHQAMALLAAVLNRHREVEEAERPRFLVVCPTSVIYHWKEKLAQFLPALRVYTYHGAARTLELLADHDVMLTTYGVMRSEKDGLSAIHFEVAIFDEIQIAKNHNSRTHAALCKVEGRMRLGLTGTPIENNIRELKALFDIALPTYLPPESQYRETFIVPIEQAGDQEAMRLLRRVVHPFILRRKKEDVLTELPDKTEEKAHCDLTADQRALYDETMQGVGKRVLHDLEDASIAISYTHIFSILTALKRICDHPAVYLKQPESFRKHASGKWELFVELLSQARESRQKVVVFSQYLAMLDIIELYLREQGIGFAGIRGATVNRERELRRFEKDPSCEVFVGSLSAAGLGIDLTAASVVIHYDRGWTKARENQATDRVHRLGQTRGVQVFKLITLNTLEERIDQIIETKGRLMEEVVGVDEQSTLKRLDREDLIRLLTQK